MLTTGFCLFLAAFHTVEAYPNDIAVRQITSVPSRTSTSYPVTTTLTFGEFPSGPAPPSGVQSNTTIPYPCIYSCNGIGVYESCFIFFRPLEGSSSYDAAVCEAQICTQQFYGRMSTCLNCIVAHGGEAPLPEGTTRIAPLSWVRPPLSPPNPNGPIDLDQANGWLKNITERCASAEKGLTGAMSITASPSTTGPYYTTWAPGETISPPIWTETDYTPPGRTISATISDANAARASVRSGAGRRGNMSGKSWATGIAGGLLLLRMLG